ncbi:uncharacterized protein LOC144078704 [Stigmatopora argus]
MDFNTFSDDGNLTKRLEKNALIFKESLSRIIDKYSKVPNIYEAREVDVSTITTKALNHYMLQSKKIRDRDCKGTFDSSNDVSQSHNCSSASQLDQTQKDGSGDETYLSSQMFSEEGSSIACSNQSFLEDSQRNFSQIDVLPEDEDSELERTLKSQGSNLSELYPSMVYRIGRAQQRLHTSTAADSVVRKYRKRLQMSSRPKQMALNNRRTLNSKPKDSPVNSWQRSPSRKQTSPVVDLSCTIESPESKGVELNKAFTVVTQPPFCAPSQSSIASLETLSEQSSNHTLVYNLTPSRSSQAFKASVDMMERSRKLMGEEPCQFFFSPSRSSDASSGVFWELPPRLRSLPLVSGDKQACGVLRPSQSSDASPRVSLDLTPRSKKRSLSAVAEQPFLWIPSPSRASNLHPDFSPKSRKISRAVAGEQKSSWVLSSPRSSATTSDQSPLSKKTLRSSAGVPHVSSGVFSASRTYDSQSPKRLFNATAKEQPPIFNLSFRPSSPYLDHSPRSKRLPIITAEEQNPSRSDLTPSRASSTSSGLSLRAQRLLIATMEQQQPSPGVRSLSHDSGTPSGISLRAKRLLNAAAEEQASACLHSPSRSTYPSKLSQTPKRLFPSADVPKQNTRFQMRPDVYGSPVRQSPSNWEGISLRAKRLLNAAAEEQASPCLHSPLRSTYPSKLSQTPKRLFPSADILKQNTRFQMRPDVYGSPVRQSPSNWEGLQRSHSDRVLRYSSAPASPKRRPLSTEKLRFNSPMRSTPRVRSRAWRHLSFDSSLAPHSSSSSFSGKKLDEHFEKQYHKFVCQSKVFNDSRCQICDRKEEASLQQYQTLVALALSTRSFKLRKRHQDSDLENLSSSKRWCSSSPGSKRHSNELLRRRLHLSDAEGPLAGVFNHTRCQEINGHAMSDDDIPTYGFPEYTQPDMNRKW